MEITSLIPSKGVAKYFKDRKYNFSTLQYAHIVANSKLDLREKQAEWKNLCDSQKDCEIIDGNSRTYYPSLFEFLHKLIELQNKYIKQFLDEKDAVYEVTDARQCDYRVDYNQNITRTLHECFANVNIENKQGLILQISKRTFNSSLTIAASVNELGEILSLEIYGQNNDQQYEDAKILSFLDYLSVDYPIPFKNGDILVDVNDKDTHIVVKGISNCGTQLICGVTMYGNDESWFDNVLRLDYYNGVLTEDEQSLRLLSEKLKADKQ